jgi:hypothetical protein
MSEDGRDNDQVRLDLIENLTAENERLYADNNRLRAENGALGYQHAQLRALLKHLLYNDNGRWRVGIKPDTDVTSVVGDLL